MNPITPANIPRQPCIHKHTPEFAKTPDIMPYMTAALSELLYLLAVASDIFTERCVQPRHLPNAGDLLLGLEFGAVGIPLFNPGT